MVGEVMVRIRRSRMRRDDGYRRRPARRAGHRLERRRAPGAEPRDRPLVGRKRALTRSVSRALRGHVASVDVRPTAQGENVDPDRAA